MASDIQTTGILLRKTSLPNDDAFLEFFTRDLGRVSIPVCGFAKSKKKALEIDYFRFLSLHIQKTRTSFRLKSVHSQRIFSLFQRDLDLNALGFSWLSLLFSVSTTEHADPDLSQLMADVFENVTLSNALLVDVYFRLQVLALSGFVIRFDMVRSDTFFDPRTFHFFETQKPETYFLSNQARQMLEFLRRSSLSDVLQKKDSLPLQHLQHLKKVISALEENHY